jgi:hypothetical protein
MGLLNVFANMGLVMDDFLAIISIIGSTALLSAALVSDKPIGRFGGITDWSILGLVFGIGGQICIVITHASTKYVGMLFRMPFWTVNTLLFLSFAMLVGRWFVLKSKYQFR